MSVSCHFRLHGEVAEGVWVVPFGAKIGQFLLPLVLALLPLTQRNGGAVWQQMSASHMALTARVGSRRVRRCRQAGFCRTLPSSRMRSRCARKRAARLTTVPATARRGCRAHRRKQMRLPDLGSLALQGSPCRSCARPLSRGAFRRRLSPLTTRTPGVSRGLRPCISRPTPMGRAASPNRI